ncbi:MAG: type II toxin-antitoxin system HipA family toxin [bacterium]
MKKLNVHLTNSLGIKILVGTLAQIDHRIVFEYANSFLDTGLQISPYYLPLREGLFETNKSYLLNLPGVFNDSLPDGWGMLLMDRFFTKTKLNPITLSALDRLAYLGSDTMGALTYEPAMTKEYQRLLDLSKLARECQKIVSGSTTSVLEELYIAGGSPGGARPKVCVGLKDDQMAVLAGDSFDGFEAWIIKFPAHQDHSDIGRVEYIYSLLAKQAGLTITETRLFDVPKTGSFFGIKRFDRTSQGRIHAHTFGNLIQADFRIPGTSYETFLKVTYDLTKSYEDLLMAFRYLCFNIIFNNRDDHTKNFSFLLDAQGQWHLSPAYDLCFSEGMGGEHFMTIQGEGTAITKKHLTALAKEMGIKTNDKKEILDQVMASASKWDSHAKEYGINAKTKNKIANNIKKNMSKAL